MKAQSIPHQYRSVESNLNPAVKTLNAKFTQNWDNIIGNL